LAEQIEVAAKLIKSFNFELGLQMMIGLPLDTLEKAKETARKIAKAGANTTRIYPALVIEKTPMATLFKSGNYAPLTLEEAVNWCAEIIPIFNAGGVNILRVGLHPSDEFDSGEALLAGPYHPSFKELVLSKMWQKQFEDKLPLEKGKLTISVAPQQINWAVGFESSNKKWLKEKYGWIKIIASNELKNNEFTYSYC
jgi:histone acetyltransferase (RNA polymerase elongator complex component)